MKKERQNRDALRAAIISALVRVPPGASLTTTEIRKAPTVARMRLKPGVVYNTLSRMKNTGAVLKSEDGDYSLPLGRFDTPIREATTSPSRKQIAGVRPSSIEMTTIPNDDPKEEAVVSVVIHVQRGDPRVAEVFNIFNK